MTEWEFRYGPDDWQPCCCLSVEDVLRSIYIDELEHRVKPKHVHAFKCECGATTREGK